MQESQSMVPSSTPRQPYDRGQRLSGADWKVRRRAIHWPGITVETVTSLGREPFSFGFTGECGLLSLGENGYRSDGETLVDGVPPSQRRNLGGRMVFIPPGAKLSGWSVPSVRSTWLNIYIGPVVRSFGGDFRLDGAGLEPRVHFVDPAVRSTVDKLKGLLDGSENCSFEYAQLLCALVITELRRGNGHKQKELASASDVTDFETRPLDRQRHRQLCDFIESRLDQPLTVAELSALAGLSPLHFIRSFKRATGTPPHRYVVLRRIERAKIHLSNPANSVTDIALATGFGSSSHFCHVFRSVVGISPTEYRQWSGSETQPTGADARKPTNASVFCKHAASDAASNPVAHDDRR
jgi:AraC family transcriptional regulator